MHYDNRLTLFHTSHYMLLIRCCPLQRSQMSWTIMRVYNSITSCSVYIRAGPGKSSHLLLPDVPHHKVCAFIQLQVVYYRLRSSVIIYSTLESCKVINNYFVIIAINIMYDSNKLKGFGRHKFVMSNLIDN